MITSWKINKSFQLYDRPDESEVATQTDYFLDRPATPVYCPGKVGQDAETQIGPGDVRLMQQINSACSQKKLINRSIYSIVEF